MNEQNGHEMANEPKFDEEKTGIDFDSVSALANVDIKPINKGEYFFREVGSGLLKLGKWILSFLFDVVKALANVFVFAYKGLKSLIISIARLFQKHSRHYKEVDGTGKTSFFLMGFSSIKNGQIVNGILYMLAEVGFIIFMILSGGNNLYKLMGPGFVTFTPAHPDPETGLIIPAQMGDSSIKCLLYGIMTIILIFVIIYLYFRNLNVASDNDKIAYGPRYVKALEEKLAFVNDVEQHFDAITRVREVKTKIGGAPVRVKKRFFFSRKDIVENLVKEREYEKLSALYISYLPFKKIESAKEEIAADVAFELNKFHQKYDRFNDFEDVNEKTRHLIYAYEHSDLVLDATYARDPLSIKNEVMPLEEGAKINKKEAISRIVGAFGVKADIAKMIFDIGLHNPKISKEEHRKDYDRLQVGIKRFNKINANGYHGRATPFAKQTSALLNEGFAGTVLFLPVSFAMVLVILPLLFTIFVAFTNFDGAHSGMNLFQWVGFDNFATLFAGRGSNVTLSTTIWTLLWWTLIWAFFATFLNYVFGMILALLINKKGIKLKKMWRTIFVITIAIPQFVSLLAMSKILGDYGPVNNWLLETFGYTIPFLSDGNTAKITVIIVNCWVGVPYTMLITSGILMNIPEDLYESARIDGAGPFTQFTKITLPYMLFVTGPYLITQFIGNINNFNVIFFLTGSSPNRLYLFNANDTDLLITWLYKITTGNDNQYNIASTLGIFIFIICAFLSLIMYARIGSTQREEDFQ
ncbi:MAG: sugar ABC transporter permease [Bacilli bacterium]|jgi:arabinogalactan oligomer/maltooligosaccharide transport system permease protein